MSEEILPVHSRSGITDGDGAIRLGGHIGGNGESEGRAFRTAGLVFGNREDRLGLNVVQKGLGDRRIAHHRIPIDALNGHDDVFQFLVEVVIKGTDGHLSRVSAIRNLHGDSSGEVIPCSSQPTETQVYIDRTGNRRTGGKAEGRGTTFVNFDLVGHQRDLGIGIGSLDIHIHRHGGVRYRVEAVGIAVASAESHPDVIERAVRVVSDRAIGLESHGGPGRKIDGISDPRRCRPGDLKNVARDRWDRRTENGIVICADLRRSEEERVSPGQ